jgi:hypothetical protein
MTDNIAVEPSGHHDRVNVATQEEGGVHFPQFILMGRKSDGTLEEISSLGGAIDIHNADVHNEIVNQYLHLHSGVSTTLTAATLGDGTVYELEVADSTGFAVGDYLHIDTTTTETTHPKITAISAPTGAATFTLDRRLDKAHSIGDSIELAVLDMAVAGTMAAPIEYWIAPPAGEIWHIARILVTITHGTAGDLGLFGNLVALGNGVLLRAKISGQYGTLTNWKTNADIKADMYDVEFDTRSGGGGTYGTSGRGSFNKVGSVLRLDGDQGDRMEVYIQDNISALDSFQIKAQGHPEG